MTVKELIDRLKEFPEDYETVLELGTIDSREFILDVYEDTIAKYVILTDF